jgi:hypothetical protein
MPKSKQTPPVQLRLIPADHLRFDAMCRLKGKTRTQLAREAINWFLNQPEGADATSGGTDLERRLKKMEDRLAKIQVKTAIDAGMIYLLMYRNMDLNERDKAIAWAYQSSVKRLRKKLTDQQLDLVEAAKGDDQVSKQA